MIISKNIKDPEGLKSLSSMIGKRVMGLSGGDFGKVSDVYAKGDKLRAIKVGKHIIDIEHVSSESAKAFMLDIDPIIHLHGKQVFDANGRKLGRVVGIERKGNSNNFQSLRVKKRFIARSFNVLKKDIATNKKNVILKDDNNL